MIFRQDDVNLAFEASKDTLQIRLDHQYSYSAIVGLGRVQNISGISVKNNFYYKHEWVRHEPVEVAEEVGEERPLVDI